MAHAHEKTITSSLTFPHDIFATLAPVSFLETHLHQSTSFNGSKKIRPNGRHPYDFRSPHINVGSLGHASGSAVVRLGDTAAVAGVRPEILRVQDVPNIPKSVKEWQPRQRISRQWLNNEKNEARGEQRDHIQTLQEDEVTALGLIIPNVDTSTACSAQPSNAPGRLAQDLTQRILELIQSVGLVQADDLRLTHKPPTFNDANAENLESQDIDKGDHEQAVAYWVLYIDIVFISLDGAAFDTAWCATVAALQNLQLPQATWDAELNNAICDIEQSKSRRLNLRRLPIAASFVAFSGTNSSVAKGHHAILDVAEGPDGHMFVLADPDSFEESVCDEVINIVVDDSEGDIKILWLEKRGGTVVSIKHMKKLVELARGRWSQLNQAIASSNI